ERYRAQSRVSQANLDRKQRLFEQDLISPEELDEAEAAAAVDQAAHNAQEQEIERLRAALAAARRDLAETHVTAPIDGLVTQIFVEEGENVVTGTMNNPGTVILEMADLSRMEVEAKVDETDIIAVSVGQPARIEVDALPDTVLQGAVSRVGQAGRTSQEGADFLVRVRIKSSPPRLRPGMTADVEILVASADSALAVPIQALTVRPRDQVEEWAAEEDGGPDAAEEAEGEDPDRLEARDSETAESQPAGDAEDEVASRRTPEEWLTTGVGGAEELVEGVFIVDGEEARFREVTTGIRGETHIQVLSGLEAGRTVITGPYRVLRTLDDGRKVEVQEKDEESEATS
ncbi:MAG: efflux RND transporter periplasmic adaptor subunit, partial [Candidatus Eisenbacteria bacterium]|nr:efflux RND transporter periplasmic adaptor subunit [Candidatus Eisenbacteria bacterium]